jgi:hypothetical protein
MLWISIVFDADPDPTFHFDSDPNPDPDPSSSCTQVRKSEIVFSFVQSNASLHYFIFLIWAI